MRKNPEYIFNIKNTDKGSWALSDLKSMLPIKLDEMFWDEKVNFKTNETTVKFRLVECINFLQNRGFYQIRLPVFYTEPLFVYVSPPIVRFVAPHEIRRYITEFSVLVDLDRGVQEMLFASINQYLTKDRLSLLPFCEFAAEKRKETINERSNY